MSNHLIEGEVINDRYVVGVQIGKGTYGQVYIGKDRNDGGRKVAIKVERRHPEDPSLFMPYRSITTLHMENMILTEINGGMRQRNSPLRGGFPKVHFFGKHGKQNGFYRFQVLVMDLLGPTLQRLFTVCEGSFTLKTIYLLMDQLIFRLECLHERGYIHRDLKPENIAMGLGKLKDVVHLIDFGLAKTYWANPTTREHIKQNAVDGHQVGTTRYMSCTSHQSKPQSRRDDFESLVYVMAFFMRGSLPWQKIPAANNQQRSEKVMEGKMAATPENLLGKFPPVFVEFFKKVKELKFEDRPNYRMYQDMFRTHAKLGIVAYATPKQFDWELVEDGQDESDEEDELFD